MTTFTLGRFIAIEPYGPDGERIRNAASLRDLITDLLANSGEEIAFWGELEARRIAEEWRESLSDERKAVETE